MQKNYHKKSLVFSIIFFVCCCFTFFFIYQKIESINKTSDQILAEWQKEALRRDEIKSLNKSIKVIEQERALLETHFAQSSDVVPFLNTIEGLGLKVGANAEVTLVDIPKDSIGLMVEMNASGKFESIYKLLMLLENSPYELELTSFDIKNSVEEKKWNAVFKIRLLSFIQ